MSDANKPEDEAAKRVVRLTKLFNAVIHGHRELKSAPDGNRFLEALCAQADVAKCVECLIAAPGGLSAVAKAFRFSGDSTFLNGRATSVLLYLSHDSLKQLYGGHFLHQVLKAIVEPPTFWNTLCAAHDALALTEEGTHAFAWLLYELLSSNQEESCPDVRIVAERVTKNESLMKSSLLDVRNLGHKLKHALERTNPEAEGPGGRHDNDFVDYRKIKTLPTADEFLSSERPFYRRADAINEIDQGSRALVHLDNQFRLLREDFLGELRHDFQVTVGQKRGKRRLILEGLSFAGLDCGTAVRRKSCSLKLSCDNDIPQISHLKDVASRKAFITNNKNILKHQSLGCLISEGKILAFACLDRNEDLLAGQPPILVMRINDPAEFQKVIRVSKLSTDLQFVQVDTPVFAYEPILQGLQKMTGIPLQQQLLDLEPGSSQALSEIAPLRLVDEIRNKWMRDLKSVLDTKKSIKLDAAQVDSLIAGLTRKLSQIQGPPGTGKSFIGALVAKGIHDHTKETILVQTYTNHSLDQFLEDLLDIGIPASSIVRLGSKSTPATKALGLKEQQTSYRMTTATHNMIQHQKLEAENYQDVLQSKVDRFRKFRFNNAALMEYLELSEFSEFFDAFTVPEEEDGYTKVGRDGEAIGQFYLLERWYSGKDAGVFNKNALCSFPSIWNIPPDSRHGLFASWLEEIIAEQIAEISNLARKYDQCQERLSQLFSAKTSSILSQKRIIACTTTAAAMYIDLLRKAAPGVILVEEAGEILESHTLTAMTANTKQLVLIGDHKQLRPKVNNYSLTVEKGDGYDLNMSLFERLIHAGFPYTTLCQQHRMRPDISSLVRNMTYPELEDAPKTKDRPPLRGCQDNIIFVSHGHRELNAERIADRRDEGANLSKENRYEVDMVLKCVRYLAQQGYGTDKMVVLTPYLGQLLLLQKTLATENDPVLNDLDSFELVRAGLVTTGAANVGKRKIRLSTIDNYQGEESEIVIASLTRSNSAGDIGFMSSPQRVNVLLSRARNALIMFGNADTFMSSRKGKEVWVPLLEQLKREGHVYEGFPVQCEQHPDKKAMLKSREDFDAVCPDGGCSEPCGADLNCGKHVCPLRCHKLKDHSRMQCNMVVTTTCLQKHRFTRKCYNIAAAVCKKCEAEAKAKEKKRQRDFKLDQERQAKQDEYARRLAEIEDEINHQKRLLRDQADEQDRQNVLSQRMEDLIKMTEKARNTQRNQTPNQGVVRQSATVPPRNGGAGITASSQKGTAPHLQQSSQETTAKNTEAASESEKASVPDEWDSSESKDDWEYQKKFEGAENEALDKLMAMIGLESVKQKFLATKTKVDTAVRQNISLKTERFGAALLGNPGTGKTTVARLYAKFLVEVGALPGSYFHETSGASLANEGVSKCKDHIQKILDEGGGVFFIDEAYQLVSGNSFGGSAVLDFLLPEIENLTGKVVFVLAGYRKQMEAFFAHNPGIPSRIPIEMEFEDYNDDELRRILCHYIDARYKGKVNIEDGFGGLYLRIVSRRIGRGRGREGFGNAREVQNRLAQITERQAKRLKKARRAGQKPNDYLLTKEDLIGPEPASVLKNNAAWAKLQKLIGLKAVKQSVQVLLDGIQYNYRRELEEKPIVQYSLNRCFIGPPGTGKTSVAKLYGRILADIGLLSNGEVVIKNPADFVGKHLGESESNTKGILASTVGKVLIIDEAYMLAGSSKSDPYKTAVIDTIVAEVQSTPGEDRCVLLLGYKDQMEEMFRDVNPGLTRRFPLSSSFEFEDFSDAELRQILDLKLKDIGFKATDQAKQVAMEGLARARNRPNFGNAGEVDIILDKAKALHQKHLSTKRVPSPDTLEAIDFDPEFDRGERAATNLPLLFQDVVGCEDLIRQLQGYQTTAANMKALGMDPREQIPFSFLFKGPPGTGKTTTAQKMGKVYYDMGFLAQAKVEICSATDMIGQYVGHTGPKVQKLLEKALGKVLFIDEAYRLAEGGFATEAMDELVDCLTKPKYAQKLVTILAGYDEDMDRLMSVNPGLTSRFPESIIFKHMEPETCFQLLTIALSGLQKKQKGSLDITVLTHPSTGLKKTVVELFGELSKSKSWGNARDVKYLAKTIFGKLISKPGPLPKGLVLTERIVLETMKNMLQERSRRTVAAATSRHVSQLSALQAPQQAQDAPNRPEPQQYEIQTSTAGPKTQAEQQRPPSPPIEGDSEPGAGMSQNEAQRDPNVSEAVWRQLSMDKMAALARELEYERLQKEKQQEEERIAELKRAEQAAAEEAERARLEQERIAAELERRRREAELEALERERQKEREAQKKLRTLGVCVAGFKWIKQAGGYRCAGGSHWVTDRQLGL